MDDLKVKLYELDDYEVKERFEGSEYFYLLGKVKFISDSIVLESVDQFHKYKNTELYTYAYDSNGFIYQFHNDKQIAELIDCYDINKEDNLCTKIQNY